MPSPIKSIPKLGFTSLSSYVADLILVGVGEEQAVSHPSTRKAWHLFFFSSIVFLIWHFGIRFALAPSFSDNLTFYKTIRLAEAIVYAYLLGTLVAVAYHHYRYMLLPGRQHRFVTLSFFFVVAVFLFARLYYSLFNYDAQLFKSANTIIVPIQHFSIRGLSDLNLFLDCLNLSFCAILTLSYSSLEPKSTIVSGICITEALIGYIFVAILVSTFVQVNTQRPLDK